MKKLIVVLLLLCLAGCGTHTEVPMATPTEPPMETLSVTPTATPTEMPVPASVYTDWSKYTPYQPVQQLYSYHPGYTGEGSLVARDDYGVLLPYVGRCSAQSAYDYEDALPFFGLVTSKGEIVSDCVYTKIKCDDDFLMLYRADAERTYSLTLAAPDGKWVHVLGDTGYAVSGSGLLMTGAGNGSLDLWNTNGENVMHFDGSLFKSWFGEYFRWGAEVGPFVGWTDDKMGYVTCYYVMANGVWLAQEMHLYLDFTSGAVTETPPVGYPEEIDYTPYTDGWPEPPVIEGYISFRYIRDTVTGETYFLGLYVSGNSSHFTLFDREGKPLLENVSQVSSLGWAIVRAGLCSTEENGCFSYLSVADGTPVFRYAMRTNLD